MNNSFTNKIAALSLKELFKQFGLKQIVLCPGSRNAPLIMAFSEDEYFDCYSIVDERSAGFFALGMTQFHKKPVALVCTSGSALINFGPAVSEAFYQRLPLMVVSADRPKEWVNQGESQTLNQSDIFANYSKGNFDLVQEPESEDDLWFFNRQVSEALNLTMHPMPGPVHINIHFKEPLYNKTTDLPLVKPVLIEFPSTSKILTKSSEEKIIEEWKKYEKVMIVCGMLPPDNDLKQPLEELSKKGAVVLTESTSNLNSDQFFPCIDRLIIPLTEKGGNDFIPELVITVGGPLISRKIKNYLRGSDLKAHWHLDGGQSIMDMFMKQTMAINSTPASVLSLLEKQEAKNTDYKDMWLRVDEKFESAHVNYYQKTDFSDFKAFGILLENIQSDSVLHIGNSSPIRYAQLFKDKREVPTFSNRGTSGIEGSSSTAVGYASRTEKAVYFVTGDLSMRYDGNAFWNDHVGANLKMVVINNGGGGIFRIIEGPENAANHAKYIESEKEHDYKDFAKLNQLEYLFADDEDSLQQALSDLNNSNNKATLLEVKTPRELNDKVLKQYFKTLQEEL